MPSAHKVKFKSNGDRCPKNLQKLRRLPECGIFDRDLLPFNPVNPSPTPTPKKHPFEPFDMSGVPEGLNDRYIPNKPERRNPIFPDSDGTLVGGATGPGLQYETLPQDHTNFLFRGSGRVLHADSRFGLTPTFFGPKGYHTVPVSVQGDALAASTQIANYRNEDADRVIQEMDDIIASRPRRTDVELEDLIAETLRETGESAGERAARGATTHNLDDGAGAIPRPRDTTFADPRDVEFESPRPAPRRFRRTPRLSPPSRLPIRQRSERQRQLQLRNVDTELFQVSDSADLHMTTGKKRTGEYLEIDQSSPSRYRVRDRTSSLDSRATQIRRNMALATQTAKKMRLSITESLSRRTAEAVQDLHAATVRQFGQGYERVVSDAQGIRLAQAISGERPIGAGRPIDIETGMAHQPVTQDVTGLREIDLGFSPFENVVDQPTVIGRSAPKLSFSNRLAAASASFQDVSIRNTASGAGSAGVGFLAGMGVAKLMSGTDYTGSQLGNASIVGGASGAAGDVVGRTTSAIAQRTFAQGAENAAVYSSMRAGSAILRGSAEGLVIGAAAAPLDLLLNNALMKSGAFSHAGANALSSGVVGIGTMGAIGAVSLAAAPETLGLSLVVGAAATLAGVIFGGVTGRQQDAAEKQAREEQEHMRNKVIHMSTARTQLLETLSAHKYNFEDALDAFQNKAALGIDDDTWTAFRASSMQLFVPRPSNSPPVGPGSGAASSADQKRLNNLFSKYISHTLITRVCSGGSDCSELSTRDPGSLTADEIGFLDDKTGKTWKPQADMQVEMSTQELQYTQHRISAAKKQMIDAWNQDNTLPKQLDPYIVQTANLDAKWESKFNTAIKLDAQEQVINAYATRQLKIDQMPQNIRQAAGFDPEFVTTMDAYYNDMETTASQLEVSVPQLIELQGLSDETQRDRYQEMQFDNVKTQAQVVQQAGQLSHEQDAVRAAGFYDIDQAFLETDPTAISQWHPSDSQIIQAHQAGMNLNQYVAYMHQLAMGDSGDYEKLPSFSDDELRRYGMLDFSHLQDELQMAGFRRDLYLYNPETRLFTINPAANNLPDQDDAKRFISRFTPQYLTNARRQYTDMIHGLNEKNQALVDQYNTTLLQDLHAYGDRYNEMVASQNEYAISHAGPVTQLLHYHVNDAFNKYRIAYTPLSDTLAQTPSKGIQSSGRSLQTEKARKNEAAAAKYGLSVPQYHRLKTNVTSKGLQNASSQQIHQVAADIKKIDVDTPPS